MILILSYPIDIGLAYSVTTKNKKITTRNFNGVDDYKKL